MSTHREYQKAVVQCQLPDAPDSLFSADAVPSRILGSSRSSWTGRRAVISKRTIMPSAHRWSAQSTPGGSFLCPRRLQCTLSVDVVVRLLGNGLRKWYDVAKTAMPFIYSSSAPSQNVASRRYQRQVQVAHEGLPAMRGSAPKHQVCTRRVRRSGRGRCRYYVLFGYLCELTGRVSQTVVLCRIGDCFGGGVHRTGIVGTHRSQSAQVHRKGSKRTPA